MGSIYRYSRDEIKYPGPMLAGYLLSHREIERYRPFLKGVENFKVSKNLLYKLRLKTAT